MKGRIAFISDHQSPLITLGGIDAGGQVVYVDKMTKHLAKLGYEIDIFTRWEERRMPEIIDCHNGIRVIHVKAGPKKYIPKEEILPFMSQFSTNIKKFIEREKLEYKLVHANFFMSGMIAISLKKEFGTPFIITFHALGKIRKMFQGDADKFPNERIAIEEEVVRKADYIIAECPQDREDLIYQYHANQDKISIIPCGFDPYEFYPMDKRLARMTLNLDQNEKIILQLGRMVPRKGIDTVILALKEVRTSIQQKVRLIIVGGDTDEPNASRTPEIGRLMEIAKEIGVADLITFVGRKSREQLKYYYNAADIFISTPWYEPFGITPIESMACGTPVIGSEVGGIKFSIINEKTGFLIPPKSPSILADKIKDLLGDDRLLSHFSENSIRRVNSFFTWDTIAQSVDTLYERVLYTNHSDSEKYQYEVESIDTHFNGLIDTAKKTRNQMKVSILDASRIITQSISKGGKILFCGNGGSAADAQHFAAELVGHFKISHRIGLPALALGSDISVLTAIGNDFSYNDIFSRQVEAYGDSGDVLIGITTSGNSENVIRAFQRARERNMICIGLLGGDGGKIFPLCDIALVVPSFDTQNIQEIHTSLIHILSDLIEKSLFMPKDIPPNYPSGIKNGRTYHKKLLLKDD